MLQSILSNPSRNHLLKKCVVFSSFRNSYSIRTKAATKATKQNRTLESFVCSPSASSSSSSSRNEDTLFHCTFHSKQQRNIHDQTRLSLFDENAGNPDNELQLTLLSDGIMKLSFNRPHKANAMGKTMLSQLHDTIRKLTTTNSNEDGNHIRCIILTSCSEKVFSAGADLQERSQMSMEEASSFVTSLRSSLDGLSELPMPMIACVEGAALGGGMEIALTADMIVAGKHAKFGLPETSLAIIPGAGGTQRLPRLIGSARAKELIFTARKIDAQTAYEYGIVQHVVEAGDAEKKAMEIAKEIANNGPLAVRAAKQSINKGTNLDITSAMEVEKSCYGTIIPTDDRLEGLAAFREKRKPIYKGC